MDKFMWQSSFFFFRRLRNIATCFFIKKTTGWDLIRNNNDLSYQKYQPFQLKYFVKTQSKEHYCYKIHIFLMKSSEGHPPLHSGFYPSTFLQPINGSKNSILSWVLKLNFFECLQVFFCMVVYKKALARFFILLCHCFYSCKPQLHT